MKIGIVSDSHGKSKRLRAALELLARRGAERIVHCGDVGSVECMELLGRAGAKAYAVAGNMDRRPEPLMAAANRCGVTFSLASVEVPIGGGRYLAATHGDPHHLLSELVTGGQFPYVCHGHTHRARDERIGAVRVINPGALRSPKDPRHPTAALLDTDAETVEFLDVPK